MITKRQAGGGWTADKQMDAAVTLRQSDHILSSDQFDHSILHDLYSIGIPVAFHGDISCNKRILVSLSHQLEDIGYFHLCTTL